MRARIILAQIRLRYFKTIFDFSTFRKLNIIITIMSVGILFH